MANNNKRRIATNALRTFITGSTAAFGVAIIYCILTNRYAIAITLLVVLAGIFILSRRMSRLPP